jgi:hypothetical protein
MDKTVSEEITSQGDATGWISPTYKNPFHIMDASIDCSSDWDGTIVLQKRKNSSSTAMDVNEYTADAQFQIEDHIENVQYRLYCSAQSAGTADVEIYK